MIGNLNKIISFAGIQIRIKTIKKKGFNRKEVSPVCV
jgi:hypothetical protein